MTALAYQLYGSREFPPLEQTLKMLADIGYTQTEGYGGVYGDPQATRAALDAAGLTMPSAHFSLDALENDKAATVQTARSLGVKSLFCPHIVADLRPSDAAGWKGFGHRLQALNTYYGEQGFQFGWHNHDFEFQPLADGQVPMRILLDAAPDIAWEADIAWIIRSGDDPDRYLADYGERVTAVHIKDIAPEGENLDEDGWADVGHGTVDWKTLLQTLSELPVKHYVVEHDKPNDDQRFGRRTFQYLNSIQGAAQ